MFITLAQYVAASTQKEVARQLGCTQGYISQTLRSGRPVYVLDAGDQPGAVVAIELKPFARTRLVGEEDLQLVREIGDAIASRLDDGEMTP